VAVVRALNTVQVGMGFEPGLRDRAAGTCSTASAAPRQSAGHECPLEFRAVDSVLPKRGAAPAPRHPAGASRRWMPGGTRGRDRPKSGVVVAWANASLSVERARSRSSWIVGIGEATLLRAANGLNRSRAVRCWWRRDAIVDIGVKCDPATLRRSGRLRIAMVFQQFGLLPWRTVRDNVA